MKVLAMARTAAVAPISSTTILETQSKLLGVASVR